MKTIFSTLPREHRKKGTFCTAKKGHFWSLFCVAKRHPAYLSEINQNSNIEDRIQSCFVAVVPLLSTFCFSPTTTTYVITHLSTNPPTPPAHFALLNVVQSLPPVAPAAFDKLFNNTMQDMLMLNYLAKLTKTRVG